MRTFVIVAICWAAVAMAEQININWSKVRPIDQFDHYWERLTPEMKAYRNIPPSGRITNGFEAEPGQFPYQVVLLLDLAGGTALCGGSVLTRNFILTAGHCVTSTGNQLASGGVAIMGAHNRTDTEPSQQRIRFTRSGIRRHPLYRATTVRNDIALILLSSPLTYTTRVQPISLPAASDTRQFDGFTGTVSGYGRTTDASRAIPTTLRFVSNPVLSNAQCVVEWGLQLAQPQNVCLEAAGGISTCNGDSGGPLTVDSDGVLQIGVVSFVSAAGCESGKPSVYARVSHFLSWINSNIY